MVKTRKYKEAQQTREEKERDADFEGGIIHAARADRAKSSGVKSEEYGSGWG